MNNALDEEEFMTLSKCGMYHFIYATYLRDLPTSFRGLVADVDLLTIEFSLPFSLECDRLSSSDQGRDKQ